MRQIKVRSSTNHGVIMSPSRAADSVLDVIEAGGLAVVPLDVSYAFLAGSQRPLARIYELKLRPASRPCPILASWADLLDVASEAPEKIRRIERVTDAGLPVGVLTVPDWESAVAKSVPRDCLELLVKDGKLALFLNMGGLGDALLEAGARRGIRLFGSSANISGRGNSFELTEVPEAMLEGVDIVCDAGACRYVNSERLASTVVDLQSGKLTRRGILYTEIERLLTDADGHKNSDSVNSTCTQ